MNVLSLFDGISCGQIAFDRLNVKFGLQPSMISTERERAFILC